MKLSEISDDVLQSYMQEQEITLQSSPVVTFLKEEEEHFLNCWNNDGKKKFCDKILARSLWIGLINED